ncbi:lipase, partial [Streptomyces sp. SID7982]|nr:lipase [Streptomyces sp. SID7982]
AAPDVSDGRVGFTALGDPADAAHGKLTLRVVREELARIVAERAASDPYLFHLDGLTLYGEADHAELPLPDRLHPDAAAHRRMGERFGAFAFGPGGPFAGTAERP